MRMNRLYRAWLSIIVTNVINLSMIFLSIKSGLKTSLDNSKNKFSKTPRITETQSTKLRKNNTVTVAIVGDKAYWVHDNTFYESDVVDGNIDRDSAKPIDAFNMSRKKFDELLDILDNISQ